MTAPTLVRSSALALSLGLCASCVSFAPRPVAAGDWHFGGSSSGLWSTTDGGDYGDTDSLDLQVTGGRFVSEQVLVEGVVEIADANLEDSSGDETDLTTFHVGAGARYYAMTDGTSRPYLGLRGGFSHINIDDDFSGTDESDTSPFAEVRLGLESMVSPCAAVDMGISWQEIFSRRLGSLDDDITTFGLFVGFSIWL